MKAVRRVVSLVPSMTETVCALGAAERLVGVTRYCCEPAASLVSVPQVGGTKNPNRDKIAALVPDLVIVNGEENRSEDIEWLAARFPLLQHQPRSVPQAASAVRDLAIRLDLVAAAQPILLRIEAQITAAEVAALQRTRCRVFYAIWKKPWMGANADTYIHDVLTRAGADNVCAGFPDRYPKVDATTWCCCRPNLTCLPTATAPRCSPAVRSARAPRCCSATDATSAGTGPTLRMVWGMLCSCCRAGGRCGESSAVNPVNRIRPRMAASGSRIIPQVRRRPNGSEGPLAEETWRGKSAAPQHRGGVVSAALHPD